MMETFVLSITLKRGNDTLKVSSNKITNEEYTVSLNKITEKATTMAGKLGWTSLDVQAEIGQTWTK
jgi:hypothetical protein